MNLKVWQQFKEKVVSIDKIAEWALGKHNQKISQKYNNIQNTIKILNTLIQDFGKKADSFQMSIKGKTRIQQLQFQKEYYKKRIKQCSQLAEKLKTDLYKKKNQISFIQEQTEDLKKKLIIAKTNNIKTVIKIEDIQRKTEILYKKQQMIAQKSIIKCKKSYQRNLLLTNKSQDSDPLKRFYQESEQIQKILYNKIDNHIKLKNIINQSYLLLKEKLKLHQKKSNLSGLAGSLFFRLEDKKKQGNPKNIDDKLIIYDILKEKHNRFKKQERKKLQTFYINQQDFIKFNPLQILGVIELKGGLKAINKKNIAIRDKNKQNVK